MGQILKESFLKAKKIGGVRAQMKLTVLTGMALPRAEQADDDELTVKKFHNALKLIEKELK
ncbi:MAG: hypothetical protein ACLFR2_05070 [Candidatus Kapaibacterium sp.]